MNSARPLRVRLETVDGAIVLYHTLGTNGVSSEETDRNIYRIRNDGTTVWQVAARPGDSGPFTNVYFDEVGVLKAYAWDGGEYALDAENGAILSSELIR